jgi:histidinol-phosphate aminotransferase
MELAVRRVETSAFGFSGKFRFLRNRSSHQDVVAALGARGIEIGRAFPPLDQWARISIGLARENALARDAIVGLLR